jgi:hypothetical protein
MCAFNEKPQQTLLKAFTVMDWVQSGIKENFIEYLKKNYSDMNASDLVIEINKTLKK